MKLSSKPKVPKRRISPEKLASVMKRMKAGLGKDNKPSYPTDEETRFKLGGQKIKMFQGYDPVDITGAIPISVDPKELERVDVSIRCFGVFINQCLNKNTLQVYDHLAIPKYGPFPFYHMEGKCLNEGLYRDVAESAFRWYRDNLPEGSRMKFKQVTKMSCAPDGHPFYYITFVVVDKRTWKEKTLQAQLMQLDFGYWQLGILRNASNGRILAAIQLKPAPTGETADELSVVLKKKWKEAFLRKEDIRN